MSTEISDDELEAMMGEINSTTPLTPAPTPVAAPEPEPVAKPKIDPVKVGNEVALKRFIDMDQLKADVAINPNDLDSAMIGHASLFVHYATQAVYARRQHERLKNAFEILEARLDAEYRESLGAESAKKPTEAAIRNALVADRRWSAANARVIEAQSIWKLAEIAERAFDQRKDMVLEVARDRRKEREGELRVLEQTSIRDAVISAQKSSRSA